MLWKAFNELDKNTWPDTYDEKLLIFDGQIAIESTALMLDSASKGAHNTPKQGKQPSTNERKNSIGKQI